MAREYQLIIDSCCELPREFWDRPDITMLHFTYQDGDESFVDDLFESTTAHEFYETIRKGATPSTSQPSQAEFEEAFTTPLEEGKDAVYLAFSSGISGAYLPRRSTTSMRCCGTIRTALSSVRTVMSATAPTRIANSIDKCLSPISSRRRELAAAR